MRAAEHSGPVKSEELPGLFISIAAAQSVALAVSGGGDSLALLDCVARWRALLPHPPRIVVLTVDHRLRKGSQADAASVALAAEAYKLPCRILPWRGKKPAGDIEAAARAARYRLLFDACRQDGATHLLLGHHRDDQAENFLLRLARGSGVFGLAAMRPEIAAGKVTLCRPFLEVSRERLRKTALAAGLHPVEDAMNEDRRFARVRLRQIMPLLAAEGIDPGELAATARRLAHAADAIDEGASRIIRETVAFDAFATARIDPGSFFAAASEPRLRALSRLLLAIGGEAYPPRFDQLADLADAAQAGGRFKRTLAGTVIEWRRGALLLYREAGREGLDRLHLRGGEAVVWDHRFAVDPALEIPKGLSVAALGMEGVRMLDKRPRDLPVSALAALPAVWRRDSLWSLASLGLGDDRVAVRSIVAERASKPPLFPDFFSQN